MFSFYAIFKCMCSTSRGQGATFPRCSKLLKFFHNSASLYILGFLTRNFSSSNKWDLEIVCYIWRQLASWTLNTVWPPFLAQRKLVSFVQILFQDRLWSLWTLYYFGQTSLILKYHFEPSLHSFELKSNIAPS